MDPSDFEDWCEGQGGRFTGYSDNYECTFGTHDGPGDVTSIELRANILTVRVMSDRQDQTWRGSDPEITKDGMIRAEGEEINSNEPAGEFGILSEGDDVDVGYL